MTDPTLHDGGKAKKHPKKKAPSSWKATGHTVMIKGIAKNVYQNAKTGTVAYRKKVPGVGRQPGTFKFVALKPKKMMGGGLDPESVTKGANSAMLSQPVKGGPPNLRR